MFRKFQLAAAVITMATAATPAWSSDARAIALGGSTVAHGQGAHGAFEKSGLYDGHETGWAESTFSIWPVG